MIGKTLGNRYEILEKVGEGGMAIVYKARCHLLNRYVAIKVLKNEFNADEDFIKKFRQESQAAASLSHPNILNIYDVGFEEIDNQKVYYIVMEFIDGKTLKEIIKDKGKLSEDKAIKYSLQISEALLHAHNNGIIHRDIKPHNIMITKDDRAKVTDFGIARAVTSTTVTASTDVLGSVHYFSPEQARGGFTDEKSDIYSLGIVMYEMITGQLPYVGDTPVSVALQHIQNEMKAPRELNPEMSNNLESIILKCTEKSQTRRYSSVSNLISDLDNIKSITPSIINGEDDTFKTQVIPPIKDKDRVTTRAERRKGNKKKSIIIGVLLAFILVTGVFYGVSRIRKSLRVVEVEVPNLVGMDEEEAEETVKDLDLNFNVVDRVESDEYEAGQVLSQSVDEGTMVKEGYTIDVWVSLGEEIGIVPIVRNLKLSEAERLIEDAGFLLGDPVFEHHDTIEMDYIISQSPDAFEELSLGETIYLTVSLGKEEQIIIMPDLVGRDLEEAKKMLNGLGLAANVTFEENNEDENKVFWQEYDQGKELEPNTIVSLRVSTGPKEEPEPEPEPPAKEPDEVSINHVLPELANQITEVEVIRIQDGQRTDFHVRKYKLEDSPITLTLKGKVGSEFEIYYDGEWKQTVSIERQ